MPNLRESEWLAELERLAAKNVDGFSSQELARQTGHSAKWARERIRDGIASGLIEYAGNRSVVRIDNKPDAIPVYRIVRRKKK